MLDTKVTRDEVAERPGLPVREVKRPKQDTTTSAAERPDESAAVDDSARAGAYDVDRSDDAAA
ncbi:hypothetical protein [Curtobacterium sp. ME12]|uniref:hypothetical protein n=1 Tax=Curtobacterium sp. ME12 TaxID=2744253 RepID=UPI0015F6BCBC|nr:hypothetical protein [Curtobacterium sp. ME12]